jgi:hypothetical protein
MAGTGRFDAFTALWNHVSWHAAPDKRPAEEARIVTGLGDWIGSEVFGNAIGNALVARRPATVQVILPRGAEALAYLPLETARVQGRNLAGHDITLVIRPQTTPGQHHETAIGNRLRVLGLFSLPDGGSALNLRGERQSLVQLIRGIAASGSASNGGAADIRVLQYGVTRDRLRDILQEAEGWDIIHVSGHGSPGRLVLETDVGTPDPISASDLADLLDTARDHVKLVTLSACSSAALTAAEQRRLLGLPVEDQTHSAERPEPAPPATHLPPARWRPCWRTASAAPSSPCGSRSATSSRSPWPGNCTTSWHGRASRSPAPSP